MIEPKELIEKAHEFEIHTSHVQRDYIFWWFLFGLFTISDLKEKIFLKGWNALRKGYFANTRFSLDIDLGIPDDIAQEELMEEINKICNFIHEKAWITFAQEINKITEKFPDLLTTPTPELRVYEVRVYFHDFSWNADYLKIKISLDVTLFDKVLLPLQKVKLIHPYSDKDEVDCEIKCLKVEEIIATKMKCLLQRQHAPDLFDYVYSVRLLGSQLNKQELVETFIKKTIFTRNPHAVKEILASAPFDFFKKFWNTTIICAKSVLFDVEEAISFFVEDLQSVFAIFPNHWSQQFAFYPPTLRIPIMEAGRTQTLLKVSYQWVERYIEPYSLKYLQQRNGDQKEYLYVYDRTGSKNNPGTKTFLAENFESIENTDIKFDPQFQIELCKAWELPENPFLFDPNRPIKRPKIKSLARGLLGRKSRYSIYVPKYIHQCSSCGRKFIRVQSNSHISAHKSKNWYDCYGHWIYIGMK